jgi:hypothetical protein
MEQRVNEAFNEEIEKYRRTLLSCAKKSEWNAFKMNAGKLFDYCESFEVAVLEKKFFRISWIIMVILFLSVVLIFRMGFDVHEEIIRLRKLVILTALGGSGFQLYFFLNFRTYLDHKAAYYNRRKELFIKNIEQDFRRR